MQLVQWKNVVWNALKDVDKNHTLSFAAGLSYYFVMALFPALVALGALVAYLPVPNLFEQILGLMAGFVPADSMGIVRQVAADVISPNKGKLLSAGLIGALWAVSSGFAGMIEALNVAYDVPETRAIWKTRLLAIGLSFVIGTLLLGALAVMLVGPRFGEWLSAKLHLSWAFALAWPYLRWSVTVAFTVVAIEALYFLAPNVKQRFRCTLHGAIIAVGAWIALSYLLGIYFRTFANFNKTYGALGAAVALMVWLYWTGFAILMGAEINSEILQESGDGRLPLKEVPPESVRPKPATESELAA
ncbi:MAG TPA: YihY/virulence factor BrkB family protein [Clostridia bacterium]|nr:YihY/virulence factor BrkB family protein [Clostridia bacterium]